MAPLQTRAPVEITKVGDVHIGQAGVVLNWDDTAQIFTVQLDLDGSTGTYAYTELKAL
jgi:hypothetical protein